MPRLPLMTYEQHVRAAKLLYVVHEALLELGHRSLSLEHRSATRWVRSTV